MIKFCKMCGSSTFNKVNQQFKDGTVHIRVSCKECGVFNGWEKQHSGFDKLLGKCFINDLEDFSTLRTDVVDALNDLYESSKDKKITVVAKVR